MAASQPPKNPAQSGTTTTTVVLDTNVVLDWLVFRDARLAPLSEAIASGALRWASCPRMRGELARTLSYPALERWKPDSERTLTSFDRWSVSHPDPALPQASALLCSDPDDQVFVELSLATNARWLFTRDRALLKLARRAAGRGLRIAPPEAWSAGLSSA